MEEFRNLDRDIEGSAKRWKKFVESECPEKEKFPQEWKNKTSLQKLCMMRALRPDRMSYALVDFVSEMLGNKYVEGKKNFQLETLIIWSSQLFNCIKFGVMSCNRIA